ncbi:MAG: Flp pilus assembly protein CpaB [Candidatus Omnitrophota bacterium]|jgi:pilus assembly protein CpaB
MQRQKIMLIAGIVLCGLTAFMVKVFIDQQKQEVIEKAKKQLQEIQANSSTVLVASVDIPRGSPINADSLETTIIPNQFIQPNAVNALSRIEGMITMAPIARGEQVTLSKLMQSRQADGLADTTPIGKRAITITVDNISSLAGMLKPGDYVDVIAALALPMQGPNGTVASQPAVIPLFQNIQVLAVGQELTSKTKGESRYKKEETKEASPLITLALTPQESNLIAFVQEQGKIRLVVRSPADSQVQPFQPVGWDALMQYIMPQLGEPKVEEVKVPDEYVEIYRGLNKETVILPKEN